MPKRVTAKQVAFLEWLAACGPATELPRHFHSRTIFSLERRGLVDTRAPAQGTITFVIAPAGYAALAGTR